MNLLRHLGGFLVQLAAATLLALLAAGGYFALQGCFSRDKVAQMVAVAQGIQLHQPAATDNDNATKPAAIGIDDLIEMRALQFRELENRKLALEQRESELVRQQRKLSDDKKFYLRSLKKFNGQIEEWETGKKAQALDNAVLLVGNMKSKQAKDQIIRMWDRKETDWVVTLMKALPPAKRAKIVSEFKDDAAGEPEILSEILRQIRVGLPDVKLAEDARGELGERRPSP